MMISVFKRYINWLHTQWPAGRVEKGPEVDETGASSVPGVRIAGDLAGIPLLKFAVDGGAKSVRAFLSEPDFPGASESEEVAALAIIGAGPAGISAAMEAQKAKLHYQIYDASGSFHTVAQFPKGKPIYAYPRAMEPQGELAIKGDTKERLLASLEEQRVLAGVEPIQRSISRVGGQRGDFTLYDKEDRPVGRAKRVLIAVGKSGRHRKLGVEGEKRSHVLNRLHDPNDYADKKIFVIGGGDSALETAAALACCGAEVTISYRQREFSRAKPENVERIRRLVDDPNAHMPIESASSPRESSAFTSCMMQGAQPKKIRLMLGSQVVSIGEDTVDIKNQDGGTETLEAETVFAMLGQEPPLDFLRRSGLKIRGDWSVRNYAGFAAFMLFCVFLYNWKSGGALNAMFKERNWFPFGMNEWLTSLFAAAADPASLLGTLAITLEEPGFYYALAYSVCVVGFGVARIRRRKTPYVKLQTYTLIAIQLIPLFLLPYILLPFLGHNGVFDAGLGKAFADALFPATEWSAHGREYWRAFGFILAWPLFIWNFFTSQPMWGWLIIGFVQTFVLIPLMVYRWGKGAYCGWICSCGALAETLGDTHRHKMPHGPIWNRLNMVGQAILFIAFGLMLLRLVGWTLPQTAVGAGADRLFWILLYNGEIAGARLNYYWLVDVALAGIVGVGFYFWFSGRVWCRFACPLAAWMHIVARFSRFRIFADKKRCISCNQCTATCHQGIDVMSFANKGIAMNDPQCVRCSACVQLCPTGVLRFGRLNAQGVPAYDRVLASPMDLADRIEARP